MKFLVRLPAGRISQNPAGLAQSQEHFPVAGLRLPVWYVEARIL